MPCNFRNFILIYKNYLFIKYFNSTQLFNSGNYVKQIKNDYTNKISPIFHYLSDNISLYSNNFIY